MELVMSTLDLQADVIIDKIGSRSLPCKTSGCFKTDVEPASKVV